MTPNRRSDPITTLRIVPGARMSPAHAPHPSDELGRTRPLAVCGSGLGRARCPGPARSTTWDHGAPWGTWGLSGGLRRVLGTDGRRRPDRAERGRTLYSKIGPGPSALVRGRVAGGGGCWVRTNVG